MNKILITGSNGFLGRYLCEEAKNLGFAVRAATRVPFSFSEGIENFVIGNIDASTDWTKSLLNCDVVIHLAARVHVMHSNKIDSLNEFRRVNVLGTKQLAKSAAMNGVKRFIYVSSIHVNGLFTENNNVTSFDTYEDYQINGIHRGYFENLIDNFIRKIKGNHNSENSLLDAIESIRICDMISNSINKNGIVSKM